MRIKHAWQQGSVLLEVILAVVLFAGAAVVVGIGLKAAMDGSERLRLNAHAGNLTVSVISELQMGIRSLADTGPEAFGPPFEGWVWEIAATPWTPQTESTANHLTQVEVIVRYEPAEFVHRFAQVMQIDAATTADGSMQSPAPAPFGAP
jgi:type II secretory pathway pseudopilin PulG